MQIGVNYPIRSFLHNYIKFGHCKNDSGDRRILPTSEMVAPISLQAFEKSLPLLIG